MQKRSLRELIDTSDPAWPLVQEWIGEARNHVEVLLGEREKGEEVLLHMQVTTRSPMGAIGLESGGLLIDHGWLRFLGSGHTRLQDTLRTWNMPDEATTSVLPTGSFMIVAHDVVGGFFALNGGAFPGKPGEAFYFAPDTLRWEGTGKSYSQLLDWAFSGDLGLFYQQMRWPTWQEDIVSLSGDRGMFFYPLLCAERAMHINQRQRKPVPMRELWHLYLDLAQQLKDLPDGATIQVHLTEDMQADE